MVQWHAMNTPTSHPTVPGDSSAAGNTAVLVIDMQQGLWHGPDAPHDRAGTIDRINAVTDRARQAGRPVVFIQHETEQGSLMHEAAGWQLVQGLVAEAQDVRVRKTTPDSFLRTDLQDQLLAHGVTQLVVCGIYTEFCVDTTVRKALALGYPVTLVSDAHSSAGNAALSAQQVVAHHNATLPQISSFGPRVTLAAAHEVALAA